MGATREKFLKMDKITDADLIKMDFPPGKWFKQILKDAGTTLIPLNMRAPIIVDIKYGRSWRHI